MQRFGNYKEAVDWINNQDAQGAQNFDVLCASLTGEDVIISWCCDIDQGLGGKAITNGNPEKLRESKKMTIPGEFGRSPFRARKFEKTLSGLQAVTHAS
jgi:hypothetical protein